MSFMVVFFYADDILLFAHSLNAVQHMLRLAEQFAVEFDVKYNSNKSLVMRIGSRYNTSCEPLLLAGDKLKFVTCTMSGIPSAGTQNKGNLVPFPRYTSISV